MMLRAMWDEGPTNRGRSPSYSFMGCGSCDLGRCTLLAMPQFVFSEEPFVEPSLHNLYEQVQLCSFCLVVLGDAFMTPDPHECNPELTHNPLGLSEWMVRWRK